MSKNRQALFVVWVIVVIGLLAYFWSVKGDAFQCIQSNELSFKTESGGIYSAPSGYYIESVWVKAGQQCIELPNACYEITSGGIGENWIIVDDAGGDGCQDLSHIEGYLAPIYTPTPPVSTPTDTPDPTSTPTQEATPTETPDPTETPTPDPSATVTPTPFSGTPTPWPTKPCTNPGGCNGSG